MNLDEGDSLVFHEDEVLIKRSKHTGIDSLLIIKKKNPEFKSNFFRILLLKLQP